MFFKCVSIFLFFSTVSECANILGIIPTPSYSHQIAFEEIWRQLSLRGHKVTLITTNPLRDPKLVNLTEIDVSSSYRFFNKSISDIAENIVNMWNIYQVAINLFEEISKDQLAHPQIQNLLQGNGHFDVILLEFVYPELLALGNIFNCPTILVASMDVFTHIHNAAGNPTHPVLLPDLMLPFYGKITLKERLISTVYSWYVDILMFARYFPAKQRIMDKHFNISKSVEELVKDVDMIFINYHPVFRGARAFGPTTVTIAFERPAVVSTKVVSKDLKEFLDNAKEGFVYFSLGSNVKSRELNKDTFQSIIGALRELPYKVLYKYEDEDMPGKPDNVKVVTWAPQQYILRHPNIKVFVTQGGVQSMEEAIYSSVPTVVIPFFADQEQNAKLMKNRGIGLIVDRSPLRKEELKSAILEVIQNPSYKKAVTKLNELAQDEPMTGLERAIWWTEYVIRHKGAKHLRNPAADLPWYQFYLLDVLSIVAVVAIAIIALVVFLIKLLSRLFTSILLSKDSKKKKL